MSELTFNVSGMTCGGCAARVRRAIMALGGVWSVTVHQTQAQAVVTYDPDEISVAEMQEAARNAGYPVQPSP
jgi:copper chaperone CopZ